MERTYLNPSALMSVQRGSYEELLYQVHKEIAKADSDFGTDAQVLATTASKVWVVNRVSGKVFEVSYGRIDGEIHIDTITEPAEFQWTLDQAATEVVRKVNESLAFAEAGDVEAASRVVKTIRPLRDSVMKEYMDKLMAQATESIEPIGGWCDGGAVDERIQALMTSVVESVNRYESMNEQIGECTPIKGRLEHYVLVGEHLIEVATSHLVLDRIGMEKVNVWLESATRWIAAVDVISSVSVAADPEYLRAAADTIQEQVMVLVTSLCNGSKDVASGDSLS